jgi:WXG100 family type VII secretion target
MAEKVECIYEELEKIAATFGSSSEEIEQMINQIKQRVQGLHQSWIGRGANAFFQEMDSEVLQALNNLKKAFQESMTITRSVSSLLAQAEEEASGNFAK